jgi:hypothetical protein
MRTLRTVDHLTTSPEARPALVDISVYNLWISAGLNADIRNRNADIRNRNADIRNRSFVIAIIYQYLTGRFSARNTC